MNRSIVHSPAASQDLCDIAAYIAIDSENAADRLLDQFDDEFRKIAEWPKSGRPRDELHPGLRSKVHGRYVIYYRERPDGIEVVRVLHGARDVVREFAKE